MTRRPFRTAAIAVGVLAIALFGAVLVTRGQGFVGLLFIVAFLAAFAALALAASDNLRARHDAPTAKPRTRLGWWAVWLAVAGTLLATAFPAIMTAVRPAFDGPVPSMALPVLAGFAASIAGGVVALIAWFRRAETSLLVLLTMLPALFALSFLIGEFTFPH
ncbi:hypothetical protein [Sinomonas sp. P10A9]|uniref:Uncharacterized protein n=1 Tax=Sinomonas puerhi TaxID=3238584 RepID=A0AB39L668_9MICC